MSGVVTGTTRALACLALGHDEEHGARCWSTDEDLVRQLVAEVQALRVAAGVVEESELDRQERVEALRQAMGPYSVVHRATRVLDALDADGWTLHPVRRP